MALDNEGLALWFDSLGGNIGSYAVNVRAEPCLDGGVMDGLAGPDDLEGLGCNNPFHRIAIFTHWTRRGGAGAGAAAAAVAQPPQPQQRRQLPPMALPVHNCAAAAGAATVAAAAVAAAAAAAAAGSGGDDGGASAGGGASVPLSPMVHTTASAARTVPAALDLRPQAAAAPAAAPGGAGLAAAADTTPTKRSSASGGTGLPLVIDLTAARRGGSGGTGLGGASAATRSSGRLVGEANRPVIVGDRVANTFPGTGFHDGTVVGINESNKPFSIAWSDGSSGKYTQKDTDKWRIVIPPFCCTQCKMPPGRLWLDQTLPKNKNPDRWPSVFCRHHLHCENGNEYEMSRLEWNSWGKVLHCEKAREVKRART